MGTASLILYAVICLPAVLAIWPISYKIQTVEREYSLDFALHDDASELEMIPPSSFYNQIKSKMTFLRSKPKPKRKRTRKRRKYKIVEMFKRLWSSKLHGRLNKTQSRNPHKSILTIRNLQSPGRKRIDETNIGEIGKILELNKLGRQSKQSARVKKTKDSLKGKMSITSEDSKERKMTSTEQEESYDDLKREYVEMLDQETKQRQLFNYTDKRNQTVKQKILSSAKKPKNCTQESWTAIGLGTISCLWDDLAHARGMKDYHRVLRQFARLLVVWTSVVGVTVTILWCWRGWCCCCCVCIRWCYPDDVVYDIKRYLVLNPPGILIQSDGSTLQYSPTEREYFAYQKLKYSVSQYS